MYNNIEDKLKKARIKMFRQQTGLMFFGICCFKFKWQCHEMDNSIEGFVSFNPKNLNETSDSIIHLNKSYIERSDYTHDNVVALVIHELLHILKKHGLRRRQRNSQIWALACDHVVDREIKDMNLKFYNNQFNIIKDLHNMYPKCSTEQAYEWLDKNITKFTFTMNDDGKSGIFTDQNGNKYNVNINVGGVDQKNIKNNDIKNQESLASSFVSQARSIFENLKQKGNMSSKMVDYLSNLLAVTIPWEELLEKAIKTNVIQKPDERNWRCLNKFYMPHNITLPGYSLTESTDGTGTIIIGIDTSGSISKNELKKFAHVIVQSMNYFQEIILITHDVDIQQIQIFNSDETTSFLSYINNYGFQGRGGTSHKHIFNHIENEIWYDIEKRDNLSMVMCLTDGYSDIKEIYKKYEWITNNIPFILVLTENGAKIDINEYEIETIYIN